MSSSTIELKKLPGSVAGKLDDSVELATRMPLPPSTSTIYLDRTRSVTTVHNSFDDTASQNVVMLPPADGGFGAWAFVSAT